jgi:hypothetical protein
MYWWIERRTNKEGKSEARSKGNFKTTSCMEARVGSRRFVKSSCMTAQRCLKDGSTP